MSEPSDNQNNVIIDKILFKQFCTKPSIQLAVIFCLLAIGIFTSLSYSNFLYLQAQSVDKLSVFNEIIKPLSGVTLLLSLIIGIITASQLMPYFFSKGQQNILQQMSLSKFQFFVLITKLNLKFILIPFYYFLIIYLFIVFNSDLDLLLFFTTSSFLLFGILLYTFASLTISLNSKSVIFSILISFVAIVLLVSLDQIFIGYEDFYFLTIFNKLFLSVREGSVSLQEILHLIVWLLFAIYMMFNAIDNIRNRKKQSPTKSLLIGFAIVVISLKLIAMIMPDHNINTSITTNNQLSEYYQNQLKNTLSPVEITAVVDSEESKDEIIKAVNRLKVFKHDISIKFSNRQAFMDVSKERNGQIQEFVSIKIGNKQQTIGYPFASSAQLSIAKLIDHIESKSAQWITFIQGHDEVSIFSKSGRSFSKFYAQLKALGFPVVEQNLRKQKFISNNTKLVVIADSRQEWLADEVESLMQYLQRGGNLLMMREANDKMPKALSDYLGVSAQQGTLIDEQGFSSGTPHPAILIVNEFSQHSVNQGINSLLAFPWSIGLNVIDPTIKQKGTEALWKSETILASHQQVWNEIVASKKSNSTTNSFVFDPPVEKRKPHSLLIALERKFSPQSTVNSHTKQRVLVIGDTSFISDTAINNYANLQLGINMINWLLSYQSYNADGQLQNQSIEGQYQDNYIRISPITHFMLNWFFSFVFPFSLLIFFIYQGIKERRRNAKT
ncbi:MAG: hypothetical protein COB38_09650 [Gammaproteobacteria bacterium]|nr:MAG: hypothetical protein COB38_09650 [Gammaproteobacteria bacterium]